MKEAPRVSRKERANQVERTESVHVRIPWEEEASRAYAEHAADHPEHIPYVREALRALFEESLSNMRLYSSDTLRASFPYTHVSVAKVAKSLLHKHGHVLANRTPAGSPHQDDEKQTASERKHTTFLFGSVMKSFHGQGLTFSEEVIRQVMKRLPAALEAVRAGREPEDFEIYTLGFPTNELGHMDPSFLESARHEPFKAIGALYAESIKKEIGAEGDADKRRDVTFSGVSMGCNFAAEAADILLREQALTQARGNQQLPHLALRFYSPTGLNDSRAQIVTGFIADAVATLATRKEARNIALGEVRLMKDLKSHLGARSDAPRMVAHMDDEQARMKEDLLATITDRITRGVPIPGNLQATSITGLADATLFSSSRLQEALRRRRATIPIADENDDVKDVHPLSRNLLPRDINTRREVGVKSLHNVVLFGQYRESELKRWDIVADTLRKLANT